MLFIPPPQKKLLIEIGENLIDSLPKPDNVMEAGMRGASSILTFISLMSRFSDNEKYSAIADSYLNRIVELLNGRISISLYSGLSGIALSAYVSDLAFQRPVEDKYSEIQAALLKVVTTKPEVLHFDHIAGLVGLLSYCHIAVEIPGSKDVLLAALELLAGRAIRSNEGCYWETPVEWLPVEHLGLGQPIKNLGIAHGVPGVIAILAALHRDNLLPNRLLWMLTESCDWLTKRVFDGEGKKYIGYVEGDKLISRMAWCYGAPGVSYCLALAGTVLKNQGLLRLSWNLINTELLELDYKSVWLHEPTICHGYCGVGHMFKKTSILLKTAGFPVEIIQSNASRLYARSFHELKEKTFRLPITTNPFAKAEWFDFLEGLTGIVMLLLAADENKPQPWEALLLTQ